MLDSVFGFLEDDGEYLIGNISLKNKKIKLFIEKTSLNSNFPNFDQRRNFLKLKHQTKFLENTQNLFLKKNGEVIFTKENFGNDEKRIEGNH